MKWFLLAAGGGALMCLPVTVMMTLGFLFILGLVLSIMINHHDDTDTDQIE